MSRHAATIRGVAVGLLLVALAMTIGATWGAHRRLDDVERTQAGQGATVVQLDADVRRLTHEVCQLRERAGDPC